MNTKLFFRIIKIQLVFLMATFFVNPLTAATKHQRYLKNKLELVYYANDGKKQTLNNTEMLAGKFKGAFFKNASMKKTQDFVKALFSSSGDAKLQELTSTVTKIRGKKVYIYLIDESSKKFPSSKKIGGQSASWLLKSSGYIWYQASHFDKTHKDAGQMWLSSYHMNRNSLREIKETFVHELVHTQDLSEGRGHIFFADHKRYRYGQDDDHYGIEVLPDLQAALKEAFGNALTLYYSPVEEKKIFEWFAGNGDIIIETAAPPASLKATRDARIWLYDILKKKTGKSGKKLNAAECRASRYRKEICNNYVIYKLTDIPSELAVQNENILALIISNYIKYCGLKAYLKVFKKTNSKNNNLGKIIEAMCKVGLPKGVLINDEVRKQSRELTAGNQKELIKLLNEHKHHYTGSLLHILPLAYVDYFTGFQSTQADFKKAFEGKLPNVWIELYFGTAEPVCLPNSPRAVVLNAANPSKPKQADLANIAKALKIGNLF